VYTPAFQRYVFGNAPVKKLAGGFDWVEGPVWFADAGCLLFSDIPNNRIMRFTPGYGISTYREPSNFANGHTRDRLGRLISCEHGTRRVIRTEIDGSITVIADSFNGKRLNSPNDVVVKSDGTIWFTDAVVTDAQCPNGLAFSPTEDKFYLADTGRMYGEDPTHIRTFNCDVNGKLSGGDVFHIISPGLADGFRVDTDGNLWSSAADGVHCISPDGDLLGKILVPELVSNVCFGGPRRHQLFITASTSIYVVALNRQGALMP
jgi:gluconolactonase